MARLCAHRLPDGSWVLDCQADLLDHLTTRLVVPLIPIADVGTPMARLNPLFEIEGETLVMMTQFAGAVPAGSLERPALPLHDHQGAIAAALDMLLVGF
jgi:toxin CcdB